MTEAMPLIAFLIGVLTGLVWHNAVADMFECYRQHRRARRPMAEKVSEETV